MIRLTRYHDPHIYSRAARNLERIQYGLIRYKVRCLNINMVLRTVNQTQIIVMDRLCLRVRPAGYDLHRISSAPRVPWNLKETVLQEEILLRRIVPVQYKPHCQRRNRRTFNTQMSISPVPELLIPSQILSSHVKSAHETDPAVNDHDLSVVTVVYAELELPQQRREKLRHKDSLFFQTLPVSVLHRPASHTVEEHTNLNAFPRFLDEHFLYLLPQLVVADDIVLQVNITLRPLHLFNQRAKLRFPVRIDPDIVIVCQYSFPGFQIIEDQILKSRHLRIRQPEPLVINRLLLPAHSIFQLAFYLLCLEHSAFMKILPDDQIQDKPEDRYKIQQKKPCPYRLRRPSLKKHNNQCEKYIDDDYVIHNKIIDHHRSVPNCFCHNKTPLFKSTPRRLSSPARFPRRMPPPANAADKSATIPVYPQC